MTTTSMYIFRSDLVPHVGVLIGKARVPSITLRLHCPTTTGLHEIEISLSGAAWRAVLDELAPAIEPPANRPAPESSVIKPAPDDERVLLSIWPDAARALGIGRTKLFQLIGDGEIETVTIGRRVLIPADALREYVQRLRDRP